ncbi:MAG: hemolysin XhlA family protein [Defluviitaleaceae bacterium]|nr:hemolysin XhlA family protein [Defluviitaleaceae bacterium]
MNKEDKILEMLENLTYGQSELKSEITGIKTRLDNIEEDVGHIKEDAAHTKTRLDNIEADVGHIKEDVAHTKTRLDSIEADVAYTKSRAETTSQSVAVIEVEHGKMLGALSDGYSLMSDNIKTMLPEVKKIGGMVEDISMIKSVVTIHSTRFAKMKAVM